MHKICSKFPLLNLIVMDCFGQAFQFQHHIKKTKVKQSKNKKHFFFHLPQL